MRRKRTDSIKVQVTQCLNRFPRTNWRGKVISPEYGYEAYIFDNAGPLGYEWAETQEELIGLVRVRVEMIRKNREARAKARIYTV